MSVSSAVFLLFLAVTAAVYYLLPKRLRYLALLAASVGFYVANSLRAGVWLLLTMTATYCCGLALDRSHRLEKEAAAAPEADRRALRQQYKHSRRLLLGSTLFFCFALLAAFKYLSSWLQDGNRLLALLGTGLALPLPRLLLPLGISFYTFQTAGYLIDVFRGKAAAERHFLKYALFACYFPQMIQGPINRYRDLQPQLTEGRDFDPENLRSGIQLMLWGILKKVFLADPLAAAVGEVYANFTAYSGAVSFLAAALYCVQLYADFSGGTDLVRGASRLFGIEMAENFRRPYFARSVDEFWRRWHISLGAWMKDYLFYPLALSKPFGRLGKRMGKRFGSQAGKLTSPCLATLIVFLAVGLWQGPGLQNLAYGLWNGLLISLAMVMEKPFASARKRLHLTEDKVWWRCFQVLRTCFLVIIGRYFSRGTNLYESLRMLWRTVRYFGWSSPGLSLFTSFGLSGWDWLRLGIAGGVLLLVSGMQERGLSPRRALDRLPVPLRFLLLFAVLFLLLACVYLNGEYTAIQYVYEQI